MTILPIAYLPPAEWFARLAAGGCTIDIGENWVKQTVRNRCEIMTSGGAATLTVPVHGYGGKVATKDVRIDNSRNWQHPHWFSLVSAYRNSPYFDHYEERFAGIYARRVDFLVDLNLSLLDILTDIYSVASKAQISDSYVVSASNDLDLRGKKAFRRLSNPAALHHTDDSVTTMLHSAATPSNSAEYTQVFSATVPFVGGLSVVDLLFCEGPRTLNFLLIND